MKKVSIIIPVYKSEQFLEKLINSILEQTYTNFELILVDDGSPDNSGLICDQYSKIDSRIVVIHKINGGKQRNQGYIARNIRVSENSPESPPSSIKSLISRSDMGINKIIYTEKIH